MQTIEMVVKKCEKHGDLFLADVVVQVRVKSVTYRCKACKRERQKAAYYKNIEHYRAKDKEYRERNKERVKEIQKQKHARYYKKHKEKLLVKQKMWRKENPEKKRAQQQRFRIKHYAAFRRRENLYHSLYRENLSDCYVRKLICRHSKNLRTIDIPPEVVELKRILVAINRKLKKEEQ